MFRYPILGLLLLLSACATNNAIPQLSDDAANSLSRGKMTVVFFDSKETINFIIEVYEVLNITQRKISSSYRDDWSSEELINKIHLREFANQGLKVRMFTEVFSKADLEKVRKMHLKIQEDKIIDSESKTTLSSEVKNMLLERQIKNLVIIDWSGFSLFIKSRGLPASNVTTTNYSIYNVKSGDLAWSGSTTADLPIDLQGQDGRVYLENNKYAQLKFEVKRLVHSLYAPNKNNIWKIMGLDY